MVEVCRQPQVLEIGEPSSIMRLAGNLDELRAVAPGVLRGGVGNEAWFAFVSVWQSSVLLGRQWVQQQGARHVATSPSSPTVAALQPVLPRPVFPPLPPLPLVSAAASSAHCAATVAVLAAGKRPAAAVVKLLMGPNLSGRADLGRSWENVLVQCRMALCNFDAACPRLVQLYSEAVPSLVHLAVHDDVYRDRCQSPSTIRGYIRALDLNLWAGSLGIPASL